MICIFCLLILQGSILYCSVHCPNGLENRGWGEAETSQLPNVKMSLKIFSEKVNELLSSHMGTLPLLRLVTVIKEK